MNLGVIGLNLGLLKAAANPDGVVALGAPTITVEEEAAGFEEEERVE
jgi:hypothetical protein